MRTRKAIAISGAAHAGVIVWALIAGLFPPSEPEESLQIASVGIVSSAEFDALVSRTPGPAAPAPEAPAAPAEPETPDAPAPVADTPPPQPRPETPAPPDATPPDPSPDVAQIVTAPPTEAVAETPDAPPPPPDAPDAPPSPSPTPRPAERVAQVPAPAPPPLTETAPTVEAPSEPAPAAEPEEPEEPAEEAAPEETTTAEVTEADVPAAAEEPVVVTSRAPETSKRPGLRPSRPEPVQTAAAETSAPASEPAPAAETASDPTPTFDASAAMAEAMAGGGSAAQEGPQLSDGQREGFRLAVQACWDLGAVSTDTLRTIVEVRFEMRPDGFPVSSSIRVVSSRGGTEVSTQIALDKARQAIIGCARDNGGYDLPAESFDDWKDIIITFDPTRI